MYLMISFLVVWIMNQGLQAKGINKDEKETLLVVRSSVADSWTETGRCDNCKCRDDSTYMVDDKGSARSCFDHQNIKISYGFKSVLLNGKGYAMNFIGYNHASNTWNVEPNQWLFTSKKTLLTTDICKVPSLGKLEVFNFNKWQSLRSNGSFSITTRKLVLLNIQKTLAFATLQGLLIKIRITCGGDLGSDEYIFFTKFEGQRNHTSNTPVSILSNGDEKSLGVNVGGSGGSSGETTKESSSFVLSNLNAIIIGSTLGGVAFLITLVAIVLIILNKRIKDQHLSVLEKQQNGYSHDGSRVIVNKDVLELAQEILQERAERMKSRPDVIPEQEKSMAYKLQSATRSKSSNEENEKEDDNEQDEDVTEYVPGDQMLSNDSTGDDTESIGSLHSLKASVAPYTEIDSVPKKDTSLQNPRESVIYEPVVDVHSGYCQPNPGLIVEKAYQGIYLQPIDGAHAQSEVNGTTSVLESRQIDLSDSDFDDDEGYEEVKFEPKEKRV